MSWTAHDSAFGWIHGFKLSRNNIIFGVRGCNDVPYPCLVNRPTYGQVWSNWNRADTCLIITSAILGIFISKRIVAGNVLINQTVEMRSDFARYLNYFIFTGFLFGFRNSQYRLEGLVPNGLPQKSVEEPLKYDYSTNIITNTFWKYFVEPPRRPTDSAFA